MATDLVCPDCGGIIGAAETTDSGPPCSCFNQSGDTVIPVDDRKSEKVCCQCGVDVAGHRRAKDSRGYCCYPCYKKDKAANKPTGVRCAECSRQVKETQLIDIDGVKICYLCKQGHDEVARQKKKFRGVDDSRFKAHDRKRLILMLVVMGLLAFVIVAHQVLKWF